MVDCTAPARVRGRLAAPVRNVPAAAGPPARLESLPRRPALASRFTAAPTGREANHQMGPARYARARAGLRHQPEREAVSPSLSIGELLRTSVEMYRRNIAMVLALTVPVIVIVTGLTALGLGEFTARLHPPPPARDVWIDVAASELVTVPLITSILARWVVLKRQNAAIVASDLVAGALEVFPAVLLVFVAWLVVSALGLFALIVPGIYIAVSWYFVVQAVVIDGDRGLAAIARSVTLVRGRWWQTFGTGLAFQLTAELIPQLVLAYLLTPVARSANSYAIVVLVVALVRVIALPLVAIGSTLYYLHLRETAMAAAGPGGF